MTSPRSRLFLSSIPTPPPPRLLLRTMSTRRSFPPPSPSSSSSPATERAIPRLPLLSFLPPPPRSSSSPSISLPHLPSISPIPGYTQSTHLLPSAFPRTFYDSTSPPAPKPARKMWKPVDPLESGESRAERMKRVNREIEEVMGAVGEGTALVKEGERVGVRLEQVVERFVKEGRREGKGGKKEVTLILGHANGLPVEDWHLPLKTATTLLASQSSLPFEVVEIWLINTPLTHPSHGPTYVWTDHARDFTSFVLHYLPLLPSSSPLPEVLERRDEPARREGIVSVGHSFSGTSFLLAELEHGRKGGESLGEGLMVVDPMIIDPRSPYFDVANSRAGKPSGLTRGAVGRPDVWPSLAAIKPALLKSPFFQAFHPTQLDSYIQYGFTLLNPSDPTDQRATLAFPRWAEALIFTKGYPLGEVWDRLEFGGEKAGKGIKEIRWVFPGVGNLSGPDTDHQRISHFLSDPSPPTSDVPFALEPNRSTNVIVEGAGHLVVQERPVEMGEVVMEFLVDLFGKREGNARERESKL